MFDIAELPPTDPAERVQFFDLVEAMPGGDELGRLLKSIDRSALSGREQVMYLSAAARMVAHWQHEMAVSAADIHDALGATYVEEEIAAALRESMMASGQLLGLGLAIRTQLPATGEALRDGWVTYKQALAIEHATQDASILVSRAVEREVLPKASEQSPAQLKMTVQHAVIATDPEPANEAFRVAKKDRLVTRHRFGPAGAGLWIGGPGSPIDAAQARIEELAAQPTGPDDLRTLDQRKFDRAIELLTGVTPIDGLVPVGNVNVTMTLGTALQLAEQPALLAGHGVISPAEAQAVTNSAEWRAFINDATTGALEGFGTASYQPTKRLREFTNLRHQTSVQPMSSVPSARSEFEHAIPHDLGGRTDKTNGAPLNKKAHDAKTKGLWTHRQDPDGTRHITSPLGFTYISRPTAYPVDPPDLFSADPDPPSF